MRLLKATLLFSFLLVSFVSFSQHASTLKGNEAFEKHFWSAAIESYKIALKKEKDKELKLEMTYKVAQSFDKIRDYKNAISWFKKVVEKGGSFVDKNPEAYLKLAECLKKAETYEEAKEMFKIYQTKVPSDKRGIKGEKSCELAIKWRDNPTRYVVENLKLINSKNDDAVPAYTAKKYNEIIFSSYREGGLNSDPNDVSGQPFPDLYSAKLDVKTGKWSEPIILAEPVNSKFAEGSPTMDEKFSSLYFTRCENNEKEIKGCSIYKTDKKGQAFGEPEKLTLFKDSTITIVAQPFLGAKEEKIYFVSNAPGGFGGYDIWMAEIDKKTKKFGNPVNLGAEINTEGDELYPFVHADGTLYFSSNGHVGIGGLDLFKSEKTAKGWGSVINLKVPLNSSGDDVAIVFEGDFERGYLTSNRNGGKGGADIWSFVLPKAEFFVEGIIKDCDDKAALANAKVFLKGSDNTTQEALTDATGKYKFKLEVNVTYVVSASSDEKVKNSFGTEKLKYFKSDKKIIDVVGQDDSKTFVQDVCLEKIPEKGIELPNIVYDYNKATLTEDAKIKLQGLLIILNDNPTLVIELGSHTDFRGGNEYNRSLAQQRAQSVVNYMKQNGIEEDRMVAKGYGEDVPKSINEEVVKKLSDKHKKLFPLNTVLSEAYITALKSKEIQEEAHQLNRRTEFKVLRTDYVAKGTAPATAPAPKKAK